MVAESLLFKIPCYYKIHEQEVTITSSQFSCVLCFLSSSGFLKKNLLSPASQLSSVLPFHREKTSTALVLFSQKKKNIFSGTFLYFLYLKKKRRRKTQKQSKHQVVTVTAVERLHGGEPQKQIQSPFTSLSKNSDFRMSAGLFTFLFPPAACFTIYL